MVALAPAHTAGVAVKVEVGAGETITLIIVSAVHGDAVTVSLQDRSRQQGKYG